MQFANYHALPTFETPSFNSIDYRIRTIIADRSRVCMIIPEWHAQAWWPDMMRRDRPAHRLGNTREVYDTTHADVRTWHTDLINTYRCGMCGLWCMMRQNYYRMYASMCVCACCVCV